MLLALVLFFIACLLAEGRRLPLNLMFLGNPYAWLHQAKEQMKIFFGHFDINSSVDAVFLQCFLFDHLPTYISVRVIPGVANEEHHPLEPHVWGCSG